STEVFFVRMKSSADSISNFPALDGRVAVAIFPSGSPVLKKVASAAAGAAQRQPSSDRVIANRASVIAIALLPAIRPPGPRIGGLRAEMSVMQTQSRLINAIKNEFFWGPQLLYVQLGCIRAAAASGQ
ncbi:MAG: hypothetical protein ACREDI_11130, partial [Roseiarcus sp.]